MPTKILSELPYTDFSTNQYIGKNNPRNKNKNQSEVININTDC